MAFFHVFPLLEGCNKKDIQDQLEKHMLKLAEFLPAWVSESCLIYYCLKELFKKKKNI